MDLLVGTKRPYHVSTILTSDLFKQLLSNRSGTAPYDKARCALKYRGNYEVYIHAVRMLKSSKVRERRIGIDLLSEFGLLGHKGMEYRQKHPGIDIIPYTKSEVNYRYRILCIFLERLMTERSSKCLLDLGCAFQVPFIPEEAVKSVVDKRPELLKDAIKQRHSKSVYRRVALAKALNIFVQGNTMSPAVIDTLLLMAYDKDIVVREEAIESLGMADIDHPYRTKIIGVMLSLVDDTEPLIRAEALYILAVQKFSGALRLAEIELERGNVCHAVFWAAEEIADSKLYPLLNTIDVELDMWHQTCLNDAIKACSKNEEQTSGVVQ